MEETLPMFSFEEPDGDTPQMLQEQTGAGAVDVPGQDRIEDHAGIGEGQEQDGTETPVDSGQGSSAPDRVAVGIGEQAESGETESVYESTGLEGPFELSPLALIFPCQTQEGLGALAANIEANGLLEEITVWGNPPQVVDGKQRERACLRAGVQPRYRRLREDIDPRDYVWAKNGARRDLTPSQKALAAAELFPGSTPGRPPAQGGNCAILRNFPQVTQGEAARARGVSRRLFSDAVKIASEDGPAVPEVREAVRQSIVTLSDAARKKVAGAPPEVQRKALALVKDGKVRTMATAVARVLEEIPEPPCEQEPETGPPTAFMESGLFHRCSVADLRMRLKPGTVDLIVAFPPAAARLAIFSGLGALATRVLTEAGMMVLGVVDTGRLPEVLARLPRDGPEWIMECSLLFPAPIAASGEPHRIDIRRVALLVCGKAGARLKRGEDVIEVPAPGGGAASLPLELGDGMALVVRRFASQGQVVLDPMVHGRSGVVSAAVRGGCTFIGADEDQSRIDLVLEQLRRAVPESPPRTRSLSYRCRSSALVQEIMLRLQ